MAQGDAEQRDSSGRTDVGEAVIVGERLFLRYPSAADEREYLALRRASADFLKSWDPAPPPGIDPFGSEIFAAYLRERCSKERRRLLLCRLDDGLILGGININEIVRGIFQSAYLGYWIGKPHARLGYMTEALRLLVQVAFEELGLHRLEANIRPENRASLSLVRRAGFRREGYSARYLRIDGSWRDHERWAITAEEFPSRGGGQSE